MKQKVMFFTTGMTAGGAERVIATLANGLVAHHFDVVVATVKAGDSAYDLAPSIRLYSANLQPGFKNLPRALSFYRRLVIRESPDIIVSFSTKSDFIALLSKLFIGTSARLIVSDRADPYMRSRPMQLACNLLYAWSDALVCQSQSVADYYRVKCKRADISVIANPLNEDSTGEPTTRLRTPTVISVGRLSPQKNHRLAICAFEKLRNTFPNLVLKIFGSGPLESQLRSLIRTKNLENCVTLEGVLPNVIRENKMASLFLFTSDYEGYPNALMEAAATSIPTVTTDFSPGTAREIIDDGINGYIVPTGDMWAVVSAATKVLSRCLDPEKVVAASYAIRKKHHVEHILDAWLRVFQSR